MHLVSNQLILIMTFSIFTILPLSCALLQLYSALVSANPAHLWPLLILTAGMIAAAVVFLISIMIALIVSTKGTKEMLFEIYAVRRQSIDNQSNVQYENEAMAGEIAIGKHTKTEISPAKFNDAVHRAILFIFLFSLMTILVRQTVN